MSPVTRRFQRLHLKEARPVVGERAERVADRLVHVLVRIPDEAADVDRDAALHPAVGHRRAERKEGAAAAADQHDLAMTACLEQVDRGDHVADLRVGIEHLARTVGQRRAVADVGRVDPQRGDPGNSQRPGMVHGHP
ncbi:hypothetical protein, partial [Methylobrevis pamukkalensis]|uniref:hypothetical protein n=1 Tax=Methylobrevis pamukkalensis TaxID=1439726 RepID=UPI00114CA7DA